MNPGPYHSIDLVATKGKERIAIEIETGKNSPSQICQNVLKCFKAGFEKVYVIGTNRDAHDKVKEALEKAGLFNSGVKVFVGKEVVD